MSEQSASPSLLRPAVIFTAISLAFYLWVVWDPIGTYGDVRGYLEYSVRAPLEWIMIFFAVSWVIQRSSVMRAVAVVLLPIFILILTITHPDHGASFWRIFGQEMYVTPMYVPRGLLIYFLLLSLWLFLRAQWKDIDQQRTFLLCLVVTFVVTSWEALTAESPRRSYAIAGGSWGSMEEWRATAREGWGIIDQKIDQHVSPTWRNAAKIAVALYPFFAFVLLLFPGYRMFPKDIVRANREMFPFYALGLGLLGLSMWALWEVIEGGATGGTRSLLWLLGIPAVLAALFLILTSVLWMPLVLFLLPAFVFSVVSLPFKLAYFLVIYGVKAPVMAWHYLHYLLVPHPAETAYKDGRARDLPTPEIAARVADALYQFDFKDYDDLPPAWVSKNQKKRIDEFQELIHADDAFMESVIKNLHLKDQLQTEELLEELWQNHLKKTHKNQSREKS